MPEVLSTIPSLPWLCLGAGVGGFVLGWFLAARRKPTSRPQATGSDNKPQSFCTIDVNAERDDERLRVSQRMEALGRLAGGIAHDFNNVLTIIRGNAHLIEQAVYGNSRARELTDQIQRACTRAASMIQRLLAFSRKQRMQPTVLDLADLVRDLSKMLKPLIGEDIELMLKSGASPLAIRADAGQLEQVVLNLAANARDAMPRGGILTIKTDAIALDASKRLFNGERVPPGRYALLTVADNGAGITPRVLQRIFEPYFTTKQPGKGTGLGLAMVYGIVQQSQGYIDVQSRLGEGTRFDIYLPIFDAATADADEDSIAQLRRPAGETILLVEDETAIRKFARTVLEQDGYKVIEAGNGIEALKRLKDIDGGIDLLLTDVIMPLLNGADLAHQVISRFPRASVLYMSGFNESALVRNGVDETQEFFLPKPFSVEELKKAVHAALDGTNSSASGEALPSHAG